MVTAIEPVLREQLVERRQRLEAAIDVLPNPVEIIRLLEEVDSALQRMNRGVYGLCEVCHEPVETERLLADPLIRFCLGDLSPNEQRALEEDLHLAAQIQTALLPQHDKRVPGWNVAYYYQPAGVVSGDYCDFIDGDDHSLHFVLGDVSGKGVAASMLMAHLHAMFRTLISINLPLGEMVARASRVFCESTLPTQYATLVYGRTGIEGSVEICNAGHLPPVLIQADKVSRIEANGLPVGVFCSESFSVSKVQMQKGDTLFLYTDGLSEGSDGTGNEYGTDRLSQLLNENRSLSPNSLIQLCRQELNSFTGTSATDDLTLMAIRRTD